MCYLIFELGDLVLVLLVLRLHVLLEGLKLPTQLLNLLFDVRIKALFLVDCLGHFENLPVLILDHLLLVGQEPFVFLVFSLNLLMIYISQGFIM